jgi:hypothetical protein
VSGPFIFVRTLIVGFREDVQVLFWVSFKEKKIFDLLTFDNNLFFLRRLSQVKILVFSAFYAVASLAVIGCWFFEWRTRDDWANGALKDSRDCAARPGKFWDCWARRVKHGQSEVPTLRVVLSLVMGITSGIWVLSYKTWALWKNWCTSRLCCCRNNRGGVGRTQLSGSGRYKTPGFPVADQRARMPLMNMGGPPVSLQPVHPQPTAAPHVAPLLDPRYQAPVM